MNRPEKRHIPKKLRAAILKRDGHCCTWVSPEGKRCQATTFFEIHHIHGFALGGKTVAANFTTYCRTHNQLEAES